jgi:diguanylate cyclase (GGDEF)-like protein
VIPIASTVWAEVVWLILAFDIAAVYGVWLIERKHTYLVFIGLAPVGIALGMLVELSPLDCAYRLAISAVFVLLGAYLGQEGLVRRTGRGPGPHFAEVTAVLGVTGLLVLAATHRSLAWELRIQDYTAASICIFGCCRGRFLTNGRRGDRFLGLQILVVVGYLLIRTWVGLDVETLSATTGRGFDSFTPPFEIAFVLLAALIAGTITVQELATVVETLRHERDTDILTGVLNRRGFQLQVERLITAHDHVASSLVMCDLDNFKPINDRYGHTAGDEVLRDLCVLLRASTRTSDVLGRIGGDEFAVYLTGSTPREAVEFSKRIRSDLSRARFRALPDTESITASFGVATTVAGMKFIDLLCAADNQLYQAKEGRPKLKAAAYGWDRQRTDITGGPAPHSDPIPS